MAQQPTLAKLSAEVIDEYVTAADLCVHHRKIDSGCLGYPTTLLLFCTLEALGNYLSPKKPFEVLNHALFGKKYEGRKVENLATWYRHLLAHAAIIAPGIILTPEPDGEPFDFNGDDPIRLRVIPFYRMVKAAWEAFDRNLLKPETQLRDKHYRATTDQGGSIAMPHASSGAPPIVKAIKM